jgi:uncharacterized protein
MTIRTATVADAAGLIALWEASGLRFTAAMVPAELAGVLERDPLVLVDVDDDGAIAGAVFGTFDGRRGWANRVAVLPAMRGRGIATGLLAELERRLRALGCPRVNLLVELGNPDARAMYEKLGYNGHELIFMTKRLAPRRGRDLAPALAGEPYVFAAVDGGAAPGVPMFAAILEDEGLTLVLTKADADMARLPYSYVAGRITLGVESSLDEIGLTAEVSRVLAGAEISCNVIAGSVHDHLFVDWDRRAEALDLLRAVLGTAGNTGVLPGRCPIQLDHRSWRCAGTDSSHRAVRPQLFRLGAPGRTRTSTAGFVVQHDVPFTTGALAA